MAILQYALGSPHSRLIHLIVFHPCGIHHRPLSWQRRDGRELRLSHLRGNPHDIDLLSCRNSPFHMGRNISSKPETK